MGNITIYCKFLGVEGNMALSRLVVNENIILKNFIKDNFPVSMKNTIMKLGRDERSIIQVQAEGSTKLLSILNKGEKNYGRDRDNPILLGINKIYYQYKGDTERPRCIEIESPETSCDYVGLIKEKEQDARIVVWSPLNQGGIERTRPFNLSYLTKKYYGYGLSPKYPIIISQAIKTCFKLSGLEKNARIKVIHDKNTTIESLINLFDIELPYKESGMPYDPSRLYFQFNNKEISAVQNMNNTVAGLFPDLVTNTNGNPNNPIEIYQKLKIKFCFPQKENKDYIETILDSTTISDFLSNVIKIRKEALDSWPIILELDKKKIEYSYQNMDMNLAKQLDINKQEWKINILHGERKIYYKVPGKDKRIPTTINFYDTLGIFMDKIKKIEKNFITDFWPIILSNNNSIEYSDNNKNMNLAEQLNINEKSFTINISYGEIRIYYKVPGKDNVAFTNINFKNTIKDFVNKIQNNLLTTINISIKYNGKEIDSDRNGDALLCEAFDFSNGVSEGNPIIIEYPIINLNVNSELGGQPFKKTKIRLYYENTIKDLLKLLNLKEKDFRFKDIKVGFNTCSINDTMSIYDTMGKTCLENILKKENYVVNISCEDAKMKFYIPFIRKEILCKISENSRIEDIINQIPQTYFYNKNNLIAEFNNNKIEITPNTYKKPIYSTNLRLETYKNGDKIIIDDAPVEIHYKIPKKSDDVKKVSIHPLLNMSNFVDIIKEDIDDACKVHLECKNLKIDTSIHDKKRTIGETFYDKFGEDDVWEVVQASGDQKVKFRNGEDGKTFEIVLSKSDTIEAVRNRLAENELGNILAEDVTLMFGAKALVNQITIGELQIPKDGVISVFVDSPEDADLLSTIQF